MKPLIIKGAIGTVGVSGLAVGGYYGVQAINTNSTSKTNSKKEQKVDTSWEAFEKTHEIFGESEWKPKYDEFRKGDSFEKFANALKKGRSDNFVVTKEGEDTGGPEAMKKWCEVLFKLKQNLENAKSFCAKPKSN